MRIFFITIFISILSCLYGYAKPIRLDDFDWGMTLLEVEARAAENNYTLIKKEISVINPRLEYETPLYGKDCVISFYFTPRGQKLYSAVVVWEYTSLGDVVRDMLIKEFKYPREEIEAAKLYIWTRASTEVELRYGFENTTLSYSNLNLWNEYKDERDLINEQKREEQEE